MSGPFRAAADAVVEEQIKAQEAWIEHTGDVTDPGDLGTLVTALEALARGDNEFAGEVLVQLAVSLREADEQGAEEAAADLEEGTVNAALREAAALLLQASRQEGDDGTGGRQTEEDVDRAIQMARVSLETMQEARR